MRSEHPVLVGEHQAVLDASPDAIVIVDRAGTVVALNRQAEAFFAVSSARLRGRPVEALLPARLREAHATARAAYAAAPTVRPMSARTGLRGRRADGSEFPVEIALVPIVGSPNGLVMAVVRHVTPRDGRLATARGRVERAAGTLDAIPDAIVTTDAKGMVDFLNRSAEQLTGRSRASACGRPLGDILPLKGGSGRGSLEVSIAECLRSGLPAEALQAVLASEPGQEERMLDVSVAPIRDGAGAIAGVVVRARDVTHALMIARQLSHQATHDALTGLVNRVEFERRLAHALASAATEHSEHALCFLDLDGFKKVNDAWGHLAGDELLRQLSARLRARMRSRDTLARLGGDEFGMLLEHCRPAKALRIAEAIRKAIGSFRFSVGGDTCRIRTSIGVVPVRVDSGRPSEALRAADTACYLAKRGGGNRTQLYDPTDQFRSPAVSRTDPASAP
jgi:diguanylate cyclase (GGDEF)-like protein/PAS domain S-box-containing protein